MKSLQVALPFWVRAMLLAGVFCLVAGAGLIAYRFYQRPMTLTVAVGSLDGEARQIASLIAGRLADDRFADQAQNGEFRQRARCRQGVRGRQGRSRGGPR